MNKGLVLSSSWEHIGAMLANESDEEQAKFFKSFLKECDSWDTSYQTQMQLASINHLLTSEEREALSMLSYNEED